jgi:ribosomal protein S18 acetylase RimI-like enzyme
METKVAQIRKGRPSDAHKLAEVYAEAWRGAYQGIIPHLSLERMIARRGLDWWDAALGQRGSLLVLEFDGEPQGYVTYGRSRLSRSPFEGEIFEIYLHPIYQGLGFGHELFAAARKRLHEQRRKGLVVWALSDNQSACAFYLGLGGKPIAEGAECFSGVTLRKTAYAWK